jgi:hypothetical protein
VGIMRDQCLRGNGLSCTWLGQSFEQGELYPSGGFVPQDYSRAADHYGRGCERGHMDGCWRLGQMWERGAGLAHDPRRAADLYRMACHRSHARSCVSLAVLTESGLGVAKSAADALALYRAACELGDATSCKVVEERGPAIRASESSPPPNPPHKAAVPAGKGWFCYATRVGDTEGLTNCVRSKDECWRSRHLEMRAEELHGSGRVVTRCVFQPRAACFTAWDKLNESHVSFCNTRFATCEQRRNQVRLLDESDFERVSACDSWL